MLVDHLGLALTKEDLQNVVDLMEPYGQITNGIEYLNVPLDVSILLFILIVVYIYSLDIINIKYLILLLMT